MGLIAFRNPFKVLAAGERIAVDRVFILVAGFSAAGPAQGPEGRQHAVVDRDRDPSPASGDGCLQLRQMGHVLARLAPVNSYSFRMLAPLPLSALASYAKGRALRSA